MERQTYYAQVSGWILGENRRKGAAVEATKEEAKFALLAGTIGTEKPATEAQAKAAAADAAKPSDKPAAK